MYRIVWLTSKDTLGETRSLETARKEYVILWIMAHHEALARRSAGYSVYLISGDMAETIWNWQEDSALCFGKLFRQGFPRMVQLVNGELRVYRDVLSILNEPPVDLEPDEFSALVADV